MTPPRYCITHKTGWCTRVQISQQLCALLRLLAHVLRQLPRLLVEHHTAATTQCNTIAPPAILRMASCLVRVSAMQEPALLQARLVVLSVHAVPQA